MKINDRRQFNKNLNMAVLVVAVLVAGIFLGVYVMNKYDDDLHRGLLLTGCVLATLLFNVYNCIVIDRRSKGESNDDPRITWRRP